MQARTLLNLIAEGGRTRSLRASTTLMHSLPRRGWVAEETLAIATYCAIKHPDDFEAAPSSCRKPWLVTTTLPVLARPEEHLGAASASPGIPNKFIENL